MRFVGSNEPLQQPWPRVIISVGRRSVPIALALKQLSGAFTIHIQDPKVPAHWFDLIAAPAHDAFSAPNVITTFGAVHRVTPERLAEAAKKFATRFAHLPHPCFAVLLGGDSKGFRFSPTDATKFGASVANLVREQHGSLLITPSRRTRPKSLSAFANAIQNVPRMLKLERRHLRLARRAEIWDAGLTPRLCAPTPGLTSFFSIVDSCAFAIATGISPRRAYGARRTQRRAT